MCPQWRQRGTQYALPRELRDCYNLLACCGVACMSLWDFASDPPSYEEADWAATIATAILAASSRVELAMTPSVGLMHQPSGLAPTVLADFKWLAIPSGQTRALLEVSPLRLRLGQLLGGERPWFGKVMVFAVTPPEGQLSPGDDITKPAGGKVGCQVTWNAGSGFLTAGHVAPSGDVHDAGGKIGTVVWANDPTGNSTAVEPDVSVVRCVSGATVSPRNSARCFAPRRPIQ